MRSSPASAHEIISNNKAALDRISRKLLERETLEGWEVNEVLREETGIDYIKMNEYYPEEASPRGREHPLPQPIAIS